MFCERERDLYLFVSGSEPIQTPYAYIPGHIYLYISSDVFRILPFQFTTNVNVLVDLERLYLPHVSMFDFLPKN